MKHPRWRYQHAEGSRMIMHQTSILNGLHFKFLFHVTVNVLGLRSFHTYKRYECGHRNTYITHKQRYLPVLLSRRNPLRCRGVCIFDCGSAGMWRFYEKIWRIRTAATILRSIKRRKGACMPWSLRRVVSLRLSCVSSH